MKLQLKKGILCLSVLAAVLCSTVGAAAKTTSPTGSDLWKYGTTSITGGGTVYSHYIHWDADWYKASVKNAKGATDFDVKYDGKTYAKASKKAYAGRTDYSYYNYGY